jgi:hypothetical protein
MEDFDSKSLRDFGNRRKNRGPHEWRNGTQNLVIDPYFIIDP